MLLFPTIILSQKINFVFTNSADPDEMWHFIWVFTVCYSINLGVPRLQRVNLSPYGRMCCINVAHLKALSHYDV